MVLAYPPGQFAEILDFIVSAPSPAEIIAFKPSSQMEARLAELIGKNKQGTLNDDERQEVEAFLQLNHFVNMLKIRTRKKQADNE